mgnify:CR=1 FL=1
MRVLFRCDISESIGMGHFSRCLVLSEELAKHNLYSSFHIKNIDRLPIPKIRNDFIDVHEVFIPLVNRDVESEWPDEVQVEDAISLESKVLNSDLIVVDHYGLSSRFIEMVKHTKPTIKTLFITDFICSDMALDFLLNSSRLCKISDFESYSNFVGKYLLGNDYALVNSKFLDIRGESQVKHAKGYFRGNLLICFGGVDNRSLTLRFLEDRLATLFNEVRILMSSSSTDITEIRGFCSRFENVTLIVDDFEMQDQMLWADVMLGSPGGMSWERAVMSLPSVLVVSAKNQLDNARYFSGIGASYILDNTNRLMEDFIKFVFKLSGNGYSGMVSSNFSICDGLGSQRIVMQILAAFYPPKLSKISSDDSYQIWKWQNEPEARKYSYNSNPPTIEEHNKWFENLSVFELDNFFMVEIKGAKCGFVRLSNDGSDRFLVSILIGGSSQKIGLATRVLKEIVRRYKGRLKAEIKITNEASKTCFKRSGFIFNDGDEYIA